MNKIIEILEASVKKNGEKPLTTLHLLNILKMAERIEDSEEGLTDYADLQGWYK